jgi:LmbE family N-acetylglucosaminyl deacetylase
MRIEGQQILAISPHLDDAVLGTGAILSAADRPVVATVFAGDPGRDTPSSSWDRGLGSTASDVVEIRRREDEDALHVLGASAVHLGFFEAPYRSRLRCHETEYTIEFFSLLRQEIVQLIAAHRPGIMMVPLGLQHVDHRIAAAAAISAWITERPCELWTYAEQPYAQYDHALTRRRLRDLRAAAVPVIPRIDPEHTTVRCQAVMSYRSQLEPLRRAFNGWYPTKPLTELIWQLSFDPALGQLPAAPVGAKQTVSTRFAR